MRIRNSTPLHITPKTAEFHAQLKARGDQDIPAGIDPRPAGKPRQATKEFISRQIDDLQNKISQSEKIGRFGDGIESKKAYDNFVNTYKDLLNYAKKAFVNAPDVPGVLDIEA
jgi:hypothetical protein